MKKVLVITPTVYTRSGIGRYSDGVVTALSAEGVSVSLLTEQKREDVSVSLKPSRSGFDVFSNMRTARVYANTVKPEAVHAFDVWPYSLYAYAAVIGTKRRLIISGVGTYSIPPKQRSLKRFLFWVVFNRASAITCISNYVQKRILAEFPRLKTTTVVPIAASPLPIPTASQIENCKKQFELDGAYPLVLTVGEIKDRKGQLDTLKAIGILKKEYPSIVYCMVGSNSDRSYMDSIHTTINEQGLSSNTRILSGLDDESISSLYSIADAFVLASNNDEEHGHFEGFGIVFLEAGQFGVPGVGTLGCGIEDAIQDGVSGFLVPQRSPDKIADAIRRILGEDNSKLREGAQAVSKTFSWQRTAKGYMLYY